VARSYGQGASGPEIAASEGVSVPTIYNDLEALGVVRRASLRSVDGKTALAIRRVQAGLSQAELSKLAELGRNKRRLAQLEEDRRVPTTREARQLARALGCTIGELFHSVISRHDELRQRFEEAKRQSGWLESDDVAVKVPCSRATVWNYRRKLRARRYRGEWFGGSPAPWLYPPDAAQRLRLLLDETFRLELERRASAAEARWDAGDNWNRVRAGTYRLCSCGCERRVYCPPVRATAERVFYSQACWHRYRRKYGLIPDAIVGEHWGRASRRRLHNQRIAHKGGEAAIGKSGRPSKATTAQVAAILRLDSEGKHLREIAAEVFGDPGLKDRVARVLKRVAVA
jgi:transcriptional regulator with XRE-family HTH domain